eukprot:TRINITY_DN22502_c0_g1_i2.p1 TRINITY_DN22502_c0_g1~~TRINITY_DN22502_c0_g1_i2.p1  ORF type:complete len:910 (-),score=239.45 TRINITY_DN22502_c0_g1_i2:76-2769(-)
MAGRGPPQQVRRDDLNKILHDRRVKSEGSNVVAGAGAHTAPVPIRRSLPKSLVPSGPPGGAQREVPQRASIGSSSPSTTSLAAEFPVRQSAQQPMPRPQQSSMQAQQPHMQQVSQMTRPQQQQQHQLHQQHPQQHQHQQQQPLSLMSSLRVVPPRLQGQGSNLNIQISGSSSPAAKIGPQSPLSSRLSSHPQAGSPQGGRSGSAVDLSFSRQSSKVDILSGEDRPSLSDKVPVPQVALSTMRPHNMRHTIGGPIFSSYGKQERNGEVAPNSARAGRISCGRLYEELAAREREVTACRQELQSLQNSVTRLSEENRGLQREAVMLRAGSHREATLVEKKQRLEPIEETLAQLISKNDAYHRKLEELRTIHENQRLQMQDMQEDRDRLMKENEGLQRLLQQKEDGDRLRESEAQEEVQELRRRHSGTADKFTSLQEEVLGMSNKVEDLMGEKACLVQQVDSLTSQLELERKEVQVQKSKSNRLQQQLDTERKRLSDERRLSEERSRYWAAESAGAGAGTGEAATLQLSPAAASCSESRLRAVMTDQSASAERLKQAIGAVEATLGEAKRELAGKQRRERGAAYEQLHAALEAGKESDLEQALDFARRAEVNAEDIAAGEAKLLQLQSQTPEEKAAKARQELLAQQRKAAFQYVKKDAVNDLQNLMESFDEDVRWQDWRDYSGRTLWRFAIDMHSRDVQTYLRQLLGMDDQRKSTEPSRPAATANATQACPSLAEKSVEEESGSEATLAPVEEEAPGAAEEAPEELSQEQIAELKVKAFRLVVKDDMAGLSDVLNRLPIDLWPKWENKAGKDLITLSQERGSSGAYSVLAKKLGLVQERKRDSFQEREAVWVYHPGEVQPLRATVLEDTGEELEDVLIEYWDGSAPACRVEKCMVRKQWS